MSTWRHGGRYLGEVQRHAFGVAANRSFFAYAELSVDSKCLGARSSLHRSLRKMAHHTLAEGSPMGLVATCMFVCLLVFGPQVLGYLDDDGTIKIALVATFAMGVVAGYRARG